MVNIKPNLHMMLLTLAFAFSTAALEGQSGRLEIFGDPVDAESEYSEVANDAVYLPEGGRIAVVGVTRVSENNTDGFLLVYDPDTRKVERTPFPYSKTARDVFNCVARADNSHLYVGGHTLNSAGDQQSLLVQYREDLSFATRPFLSGNGNSSFEKIVWLPGDRGLLAGLNGGKGTIWLSTAEGNNPPGSERMPVGNGGVKDLAAMAYCPEQQTVWLCGNTRNFMNIENGNAWVARMNSRLDYQSWRPLETDYFEVVTDAAPGQEGELFLTGYRKSKNGSKEGWMLEVDPEMGNGSPFLFGSNQPDTATAIAGVSDGSHLIVYCSEPIRGGIGRPKSRTFVCWRIGGECLSSEIARSGDLEVIKIFEIAEEEFLLVGTADRPGLQGIRGVRFIHLKAIAPDGNRRDGRTRGPKNLRAEISACETKNQACITAGETATLYIRIKNLGNEALRFSRLSLISSGGALLKALDIPLVKAASSHEISTGLHVPGELIQGSSLSLQISLEDNQHGLLDKQSFDLPVCTVLSSKPAPQRPDSGADEPVLIIDDYPSSTNRGDVSIGATIRHNKPVPQSELTVNPKTIKKGKNKRVGLISSYSQKEAGNEIWDTRFTINIKLDTGFNDIHIGIGDDFIFPNSARIEFKPFSPDLHVFAIGPRYEKPYTLEYVENDIREIVRKMKEQAGAGWFDQVYVETLTFPEIANKQNIELFLDNIPGFRTIKENDYVLLYLAGHGSLWTPKTFLTNQDSVTRDLCFWPSGYIDGKDEITGFHYNKWADRVLDKLPGKKLVFIDACNGGAGRGAIDPAAAEAMRRANAILKGTAAFYSSKPGQLSHEDPAWQHGAFTKALLEALEGREVVLSDGKTRIDPDAGYPHPERLGKLMGKHDSLMTVYELQQFLAARIPDLVQAEFGKTATQQPEFIIKPDLTYDTVIFAIPKR